MTRHLPEGTVLKAMLRERHCQTLDLFHREYDRVAAEHEPHMVGRAPQKAQFFRWMSGRVKELPYPSHCRVLEAMFPGVTAEELFSPAPPRVIETRTATASITDPPAPREASPTPDPQPGTGTGARAVEGTTIQTNARMRALMSWVDQNSALKERDIHPDRYRSYSRGRGVERGR